MAANANVKSINSVKTKKEKKEVFSQRAQYVGTTATFDVHLREIGPTEFRVHAVKVKKDAKDGKPSKKQKGMLDVYRTKEDAIKRMEEIGAMCVAQGWVLKTRSGKSEFDTVPPAE